MEKQSGTLKYFISERHPYLVVSFGGDMVKSGVATIEKCEEEILGSSAKLVILCFGDVEDLDIQGAKALLKLQTVVRRKPAAIRLCFLNRKFARILDQQGAIRMSELNVDLKEALMDLSSKKHLVSAPSGQDQGTEEERKR